MEGGSEVEGVCVGRVGSVFGGFSVYGLWLLEFLYLVFIGFWCQLGPLYDFFFIFIFFSIFVSFESGSINKLPKYQALKCF